MTYQEKDGSFLVNDSIVNLGIRFIGPTNRVSGLGVSCRGYINAIKTTKYPIDIVCVEKGFEHIKKVPLYCSESNIPSDYDVVSIVHINPDMMNVHMDDIQEHLDASCHKIAVWYWELSHLPSTWWKYLNHFDEIWVASTFTQRAIQACTNIPVTLMPPSVQLKSVDLSKVKKIKEKFKISDSRCYFLYIFDAFSYVERKNPFALLNAFIDRFKGVSDATLILKMSNAWVSAEFRNDVKSLCKGMSNIVLIDEVMTESEVVALHYLTSCYVSTHRSEGLGLTIIESMIAKKPVIATDYGSTIDFVREDTAYPVKYSLIEIKETMGPYKEGYVWADIEKADLITNMEYVYRQEESIEGKVEAAYLNIMNTYSLLSVGKSIECHFRALTYQ